MDTSMIFCARGKGGLAQAVVALRKAGLAVTDRGKRVEIVGDPVAGPWLDVVFSERRVVAAEARELGKGSAFAEKLAACDARFEIEISDLAGTLDEINTLIQTQLALLALTDGVQFNTWNGQLSALE